MMPPEEKKVVDPYDMTAEEFEEAKYNMETDPEGLMEEEVPPVVEPPVGDTPPEIPLVEDPEDVPPVDTGIDFGDGDTPPVEDVPPVDDEFNFSLDGDPQSGDVTPPTKDEPAPQTFPLVYKGRTINVTPEQAIELAQKGYDYEAKMKKIAPHRKIVELLEGDNIAQDMLNTYFHEVANPTPVVKPLKDFDSEEDWMAANLAEAKKQPAREDLFKPEEGAETVSTPTLASPDMEGGKNIFQHLYSRDPENFEKVCGHFDEYTKKLNPDQFKRVNTDLATLEKFYDGVKSRVVTAPVVPATPGTAPPSTPQSKRTFRSKSGGGTPPRPKPKNVWDMNNKDFNAKKREIMGY